MLTFAPVAGASPYSAAVLGTNGVQSYYRLGEASGNTAIDGRGAVDGTYAGGFSLAASATINDGNTAVTLNGSTGSVDVGNVYGFSGTASFSVEAWVKRSTATSGYQRIVSKESVSGGNQLGWMLFLNPAGSPRAEKLSLERTDSAGVADNVTSTTSTVAGVWYHVVATYDGATMRLYVNGVLQASQASTRAVPSTSARLRIGASDGTCCGHFNGTIDDVALYNAALPATQVQSHYSASQARGPYPDGVLGTGGLSSYWRLGERSGTTAVDLKGAQSGAYAGNATLGARGAIGDDVDGAVTLNGSTGSVDVGNVYGFSGTASFSVEAWVKRSTATSGYQRIVSKESVSGGNQLGWMLFLNPAGSPRAEKLSLERTDSAGVADNVTSTTSTVAGVWYHVVATYDGATMRLYVNGVLQASQASTRAVPSTSARLRIGASDGTCCGHFNGTIDDVAIYNAALPATQVQSHGSAAKFLYGINANVQGNGPPYGTLDQNLSAFGIKAIREDFDANTLPGTSWDSFYQVAAQNGLMVIPVINADGAVPDNPATAASVTAAYAKRYGPGGDFWLANPSLNGKLASRAIEVWNEPYIAVTHGGQYKPSAYARLLKSAYNSGKLANPRVSFLMPVDLYGRDANENLMDWISDVYAAVPDIGDHYDGVAVHPYTSPNFSDPTTCSATAQYCFQNLRSVETKLAGKPGGKNKPFWITEDGASTCPSGCVSEADQASWLQQDLTTIDTSMPFVSAFFYYHWKTYPSPSGNPDPEGYYGLVRPDGTCKPAWTAYKAVLGGQLSCQGL